MKTIPRILLLISTCCCSAHGKLCRDPTELQALIPAYPSAVHTVTTSDGYHLTAFQILPNKSAKQPVYRQLAGTPDGIKNKVVLILHGLCDSPDSFVIDKRSIGVYFLERGYQVWLGSSRGTKYSCTHESLENTSPQFWNYSWQEMADHDVPDFVDLVLRVTGRRSLTLAGHSQGTTQSFAALSQNSELQSKVDEFIAFAPVLFMERDPETPNMWTVLGRLNVLDWLGVFGVNSMDFVNIGENTFVRLGLEAMCRRSASVCKMLMFLISSKNPDLMD